MDTTAPGGKGMNVLFIALGAVSIAFHIGLIFSGLVPNLVARPLHMLLALPWIFVFAGGAGWKRWSGLALFALGAASCLYIVLNESALSDQYGALEGPLQLGVAWVLMLVVLEMARRAIGWPLPLVALLALLSAIGEDMMKLANQKQPEPTRASAQPE